MLCVPLEDEQSRRQLKIVKALTCRHSFDGDAYGFLETAGGRVLQTWRIKMPRHSLRIAFGGEAVRQGGVALTR